jgi:hypothetical protein
LVRQLNNHDRAGLSKGQVYEPNYSITTSANKSWNDGTENQYVISSLPSNITKAHSIAFASAYEQQVTFLLDARFIVENIIHNDSKGCIFVMREII